MFVIQKIYENLFIVNTNRYWYKHRRLVGRYGSVHFKFSIKLYLLQMNVGIDTKKSLIGVYVM